VNIPEKNDRLDRDAVWGGCMVRWVQGTMFKIRSTSRKAGGPIFEIIWGKYITYSVHIGHAKTTEPLELPFGMMGDLGPKNRVLDGHAHWCHLANTDERLCASGGRQ